MRAKGEGSLTVERRAGRKPVYLARHSLPDGRRRARRFPFTKAGKEAAVTYLKKYGVGAAPAGSSSLSAYLDVWAHALGSHDRAHHPRRHWRHQRRRQPHRLASALQRAPRSQKGDYVTEPHTLAEYIAWYRQELMDAIPARIHQRDLDGGGAPDWHPAFRRWLTAPPGAEDRDGFLVDPLRYYLRQMEHHEPQRAMFLMLLPAWDWDWWTALFVSGAGPVFSSSMSDHALWCLRALRALFRRMYHISRDTEGNAVVTPNQPRRKERCRAQGCRNRTYYAHCPDHEAPKSDAQINAEMAR